MTEPEPAEAATAPETELTSAEIELTVEELLATYETEGVAADAKFVDKILKITGVVERTEVKEALDIYYITLTGAETSSLQSVRCTFHRMYGAELSQLTPGQTVTVRGKYDGSIIDISLRDCTLVQ